MPGSTLTTPPPTQVLAPERPIREAMVRSALSMSKRLRSEAAGFTLVEMLITMLLLTIVLGALLAVLQTSGTQANRDLDRGNAIREVQAGLYRMSLEVRQAYKINGCGKTTGGGSWDDCTIADYGHTIDFNVRGRNNVVRRVIYDCNAAFTGNSNLPNASTLYRSCERKVNTTLVSGKCCALPTATTGIVIQRVRNWCRGGIQTCPSATGTTALVTTLPVFRYRSVSSDGSQTVLDDPEDNAVPAGPDPRLATNIDFTVEVPSAGERRRGLLHHLLLKDAAYLRNIDL